MPLPPPPPLSFNPPPRPPPSQMGLDRGPPPPGTATPWGRCYLDGAVLPLPDQVEEIGVASHSLQESLASEQRGGGHIQVLLRVPLSTSGQEPGVSAPRHATLYVWNGPSGLSMVLTITSGLDATRMQGDDMAVLISDGTTADPHTVRSGPCPNTPEP